MAINPSTNVTMSGRVTPADANYPYASAKDETAPGAGDGSPYFKARADDLFGLQQSLLRMAGIVPSGNADTALASQYLQGILEASAGRATAYDETGAADAYVLDLKANQQGPASYFDGMIVEFIIGNTNTAASTIDVAALGVKNITGTAAAGTLTAGDVLRLRYKSTSGEFDIVNNTGASVSDATTTQKGIVELATNAETVTGTDTTRALTAAGLQAKVASTSAKGIVELATNAETIAGTDTTRALTAAGLEANVSTVTNKGIVELATNAETTTGTDSTRAVHPAGLKAALDAKPTGAESIQVFEASGTWTRPAGITKIIVELVGSGGGGGGSTGGEGASGGGAGGYAKEIIDVSAISSVAVTVGAAGSGGATTSNGTAGSTVSFGAHCSATGGGGGIYSAAANPGGVGGIGSGGDINIQGGDGVSAGTDGGSSSGGGSSFFGGGGTGSSTATPGRAYGSGGGGSVTGGVGADGKKGVIIITEFK